MLRISKLTDYGIVLLAHLAEREAGTTCNAREMAESAALPFPVVGKILKTLAQEGILVSHRGARGGYGLARPADQIAVSEIVAAMEGPISLMECTAAPSSCEHEPSCRVRVPWQRINRAIQDTLRRVTLADLVSVTPTEALLTIDPAHEDGTGPAPAREEHPHG
jgi:FeS assembly SUF system regulator